MKNIHLVLWLWCDLLGMLLDSNPTVQRRLTMQLPTFGLLGSHALRWSGCQESIWDQFFIGEIRLFVYVWSTGFGIHLYMMTAFEWVPTFLRMWWATPLQKRLYLFNLFQPAVRQTASRLTITFHPPGPCLWLAPSRPQATREIFGLEKRHPEVQALHVLS